jgi:hypothetical protein
MFVFSPGTAHWLNVSNVRRNVSTLNYHKMQELMEVNQFTQRNIFRTFYYIVLNIRKQTAITDHLTGLDPAGPLFTDQSCEVRLCRGDAEFTEAIHTNGNLIGSGTHNEAGRNITSWRRVWARNLC